MITRSALAPLLLSWAALAAVSCGTLPERNLAEDKIYADIIGFSDIVTVVPDLEEGSSFFHLTVRTTEPGELTQAALIPQIQQLPTGQNTAVYYALDKALDRIALIYRNKPPNAFSEEPSAYYYTKYYVILFTDGLDNVSVQMARNDKMGNYSNGDQYAAALRQKMEKIFRKNSGGGAKRQNSFEIFLLGLRGPDSEESYSEEEMVAHLRPLMAAHNGMLHEPIVSDDIDLIYEQFLNAFNASGFSFNIPKGFAENKYRIRMEFAAKGEQGFPYWFEADIQKERLFSGPYVLTNISTSPGFTFANSALIKETPGRNKNSLSIQFTINDLRVFNAPLPIVDEQQLFLDGIWRRNSEYESISGKYKNAYVMLLMDRSDSLNDEARQSAEDMVINIINLLSAL